MSSIDPVLASTQPGLMFMPTHGAFLIGRLNDPAQSAPVIAALRHLAGVDGRDRRIVVGINGALWQRWSGQSPAGAPPADPLLARDAHFRDTGGDLFLYLKGDSNEAVDSLLALADEQLGDLLASRSITRAALPPDGKILDQHFTDGLTSPTDPASVVGRVLQSGSGSAPGSCWALAQKFEVMWTAFSDMGIDGQQNVIGRTDAGVLIPDQDVRSHIKRVRVLAEDHANYELIRQALPFAPMPNSGGRERGIFFTGFAQSASIFETLLGRMIGNDSGSSDKLLGIVRGVEGGYFYVPSSRELGLDRGLDDADFQVAPFWNVRSKNGLMFYNSTDYLNVMGTGRYAPGDPPSQRILGLLGQVFGRWQDKWGSQDSSFCSTRPRPWATSYRSTPRCSRSVSARSSTTSANARALRGSSTIRRTFTGARSSRSKACRSTASTMRYWPRGWRPTPPRTRGSSRTFSISRNACASSPRTNPTASSRRRSSSSPITVASI